MDDTLLEYCFLPCLLLPLLPLPCLTCPRRRPSPNAPSSTPQTTLVRTSALGKQNRQPSNQNRKQKLPFHPDSYFALSKQLSRRKFGGGFLSASEDAVQQQGCGPAAASARVVDLRVIQHAPRVPCQGHPPPTTGIPLPHPTPDDMLPREDSAPMRVCVFPTENHGAGQGDGQASVLVDACGTADSDG